MIPETVGFDTLDRAGVTALHRFLLFGAAGQLGGKLVPTCEAYAKASVKLVACDIVPEREFRPEFNGFERYLNLTRDSDREQLFDA